METVTEPHRLTQSLYILSCICIPLVRDDPTKSNAERHPIACFQNTLSNAHLKSYRCQALSILLDILPGIDVNDTAKSILTFQVIKKFKYILIINLDNWNFIIINSSC